MRDLTKKQFEAASVSTAKTVAALPLFADQLKAERQARIRALVIKLFPLTPPERLGLVALCNLTPHRGATLEELDFYGWPRDLVVSILTTLERRGYACIRRRSRRWEATADGLALIAANRAKSRLV